jgi:hypothetical protein
MSFQIKQSIIAAALDWAQVSKRDEKKYASLWMVGRHRRTAPKLLEDLYPTRDLMVNGTVAGALQTSEVSTSHAEGMEKRS